MQIELTGNEARFIFYSIKNKKSIQAINVRRKLVEASEIEYMRKHNEDQAKNSSRLSQS